MKRTKKLIATLCLLLSTIMLVIFYGGCLVSTSPSDLIQLPENEYKEQCQTYSYEDIMRYPDTYNKTLAVFKGEIVQILRSGNTFQMRINVTDKGFYYTDTLYVFYTQKDNENFLEYDIVILYGELRGTQKYQSVLGAQIEIPRMYAQYIELAS